MFCNKCGAEVGSESKLGSSCGRPTVFDVPQKPAVEYRPPVSEDSTIVGRHADGLTLEEMYRAFLGPEKSACYLPLFDQFDSTGGMTTWNRPAAFITQLWMIYKGMFLWGFL